MSASARRIALPLTVLLAGTSLTACSQLERGGVAARVNDTVITEQQVADATDQLRANPELDKVTPLEVTRMLSYGALAEPIAKKYGVNRSVDDMRAALAGPQAAAIDKIGPDGLEVLRINYLLREQTSKETPFTKDFIRAVEAAKLEVNPRIGTVDTSAQGQNLMADALAPWFKATSVADKATTGRQ